MFIRNLRVGKVQICINKVKGGIKSNIFNGSTTLFEEIENRDMVELCDELYKGLKSGKVGCKDRGAYYIINNDIYGKQLIDRLDDILGVIGQYTYTPMGGVAEPKEAKEETKEEPKEIQPKEVKEEAIINKDLALEVDKKIVEFFKDFNIDIAYSSRFKNTLKNKAEKSLKEAKDYIKNYVRLIGHPEADDIIAKIKSIEFEDIINNIAKIGGAKKVNQRLELMFGPAGTGKTYKAIENNPKSSIINCHSNMEPQELLTKYIFVDGKPVEVKSPLIEAMEEGKAIILDEISLLSYECLAMLQGYLDGKSSFNLFINGKNETINIKEGFKVIGTMNLIVNGRELYLPEPLVDRAYNIEELKYNPKNLFWI